MFTIPLPVSVWAFQKLSAPLLIEVSPVMGGLRAGKGFLFRAYQMTPVILMCDQKVDIGGKPARGFVYNLGPVNLVAVVTDNGMVGCGAFDVAALEKFHYPAARVRPSKGDSIATIDDLLEGIVKDANGPAQARGVRVGMTGGEALGKL
jgi:uncharacterized protein YunC (DUF1805 family)